MSEVLTYLEDCYAFNGDPAIKRAMDEIERLRNVLLEIKQTSYEEETRKKANEALR